jgi:glutathione S-transferase
MLRLVAANLNYSSWSMRAWLALKLAGASFRVFDVGLKTKEGWKDRILQFSGAGKVPVLIDGALSIHESLAICEYVHELFPEAGLWPEDRTLRARGRAISSEMASSFASLRTMMPCNLRGRAEHTPDSMALRGELTRLFDIWEASLATSSGDFLLGNTMCIADCMYAPVVFRLRTYGVPLTPTAERYSRAVLDHPVIVELTQLAEHEAAIEEYDRALKAPTSPG